MKKILCILLTLLTLAALLVPAGALRLSYATECLAAEAGMVKSGLLGQDVRFCDADFKQALGVTGFKRLTVTRLPDRTAGILKLGTNEVTENMSIPRSAVSSLVFTPASHTTEEAQFSFTCDDLCGGAAITCTIKFAEKPNNPPTTDGISDTSLHVWTQKNMTAYGSMRASDPEGDELTFMVVSYPKKGTLTLIDCHSGEFCYTPDANRRGKDSFSFVVRDCFGNYSDVRQVSVEIARTEAAVSFADMQQHRANLAATVMEERKIMQGHLRGEGYYFDPDDTVSREEFVVMAMKALNLRPRADISSTFFDDDAKITPECKGYVGTAQAMGYIIGDFDGTSLCFSPTEPISRAEAAVILCRMMGKADLGGTVSVFADQAQVWGQANKSLHYLCECGAFCLSDGNIRPDDALTRGDAAIALLAVGGH